jgi:hypothetical protein
MWPPPIVVGSRVCESCARRVGATVVMMPERRAPCQSCYWTRPCEIVTDLPLTDDDIFTFVVTMVGLVVMTTVLIWLIYDMLLFMLR